ncbi:MAG: type II toxin-antitoxin system prevent-host-death family antitoxin [Candidatus Marinimicrobia bacterium]|jgi:prevent-host-death family protein|nr:type II toxin-antitoxin system prevent-host-death family antitoxin [Candidatus Neomarinimicrobiota bacterium]MBT3478382.1 type II toxin-antitoxin system prevent-host-death family antitoxin [Candidatus Neomarinimicrobiota bacterium]MBT4068229.1 type II toxin-antitoxin system prevent-host-death family antitoxin [Candidatus Neomarinimicrobiota bacterium]MBT4270664.1 type II toxin-antitoxin system prevent-host-death family antitoxin [Candidatus Neomarinimicrobiota bacterium]MBT4371960.1 type II 
MQSIAVSDLRANLMKVLKSIEKGLSLSITSRGKEVAKLVPPGYPKIVAQYKLSEISETAKIHDIITPFKEEWGKAN